MLPEVSRYKQIKTEAGEPLDAYQQLYDRVAKTYDAAEQATTGYKIAMSNIKVPEAAQPLLEKYKQEIDKSISNIAKEAAETGRYDIASTKTKDLGIKFLTDPTLKHLQEQYAIMKPDMDVLNSPEKGLYIGGDNIKTFNPINPDGTLNTYKSSIEKRMDWNKPAEDLVKDIKPVLKTFVDSLSPEEQAKFGGDGASLVKLIERESLGNEQLDSKIKSIMDRAKADPALEQYARHHGGWDSVKNLISSTFDTGTYSMDKVNFQATSKFNAETDNNKITGDDTDAAFQFSEFGNIKDNINPNAFKTFSEDEASYNNKGLTKEQINELAKQGVPNMPTAFDKPRVSDKDKDFLTTIKNSNKAFKDMPLSKIAQEVNKNKDAYVAQYKKNFGQQNILIDVANKIEAGSGFDKIAKSLALNSRNVLVEGADPKDKGKTLKDQLDSLDIDVSDLEGANKEVIGINIDTTSSDDSYNGGLVTQITTKDGSKTFRVVSYNETYKNTFKGYANVKKDLMKLGNTESQKARLEKGEELKSNWYDVANGVKAAANKKLNNGVLETSMTVKIGEDETTMPVTMFDETMTNLLANNKYFKTNFK